MGCCFSLKTNAKNSKNENNYYAFPDNRENNTQINNERYNNTGLNINQIGDINKYKTIKELES